MKHGRRNRVLRTAALQNQLQTIISGQAESGTATVARRGSVDVRVRNRVSLAVHRLERVNGGPWNGFSRSSIDLLPFIRDDKRFHAVGFVADVHLGGRGRAN